MTVKVKYRQSFAGEIIDDEYMTYVNCYSEIERIKENLYYDSHVIGVDIEVIENE